MNLEADARALAAEVKQVSRTDETGVLWCRFREQHGNSGYNNKSAGCTREYAAGAGAVVRSETRLGRAT